MIRHNYKKLDESINFNFREDRLKDAWHLGFKYISEALIKTYRKTKSAKKTAKILKISDGCVFYELIKFGEPRNGRGGYRPGDIRHGHTKQHWEDKLR